MKQLRRIAAAIRFSGLPAESRRLVFYSEGTAYWTHLGGLLRATLDAFPGTICYVSSDPADPGLGFEHPRVQHFEVGLGRIRDWLFANMETGVLVLTMPDLDRFQVRRSRHPVRYVYVQHSLVSLHMAYRPGAFDHYDTLFCAGPHHLDEARRLEARSGSPGKALVEHGYGRLDAMLRDLDRDPPGPGGGAPRVLVAPSWGEHGLIETLGPALVGPLLDAGFAVTLRPHPQTRRLRPDALARIVDPYRGHPGFALDVDINGWAALRNADVMVSDWSGAAFEFAFARRRPLIFVDTPRKANNPDYEAIGVEPIEVALREELGVVVKPDAISALPEAVRRCLAMPDLPAELVARHVFNPGTSDAVGARYLRDLLDED